MISAFHEIGAYRGQRNPISLSKQLTQAMQTSGEICVADRPIGAFGCIVGGECRRVFDTDVWSYVRGDGKRDTETWYCYEDTVPNSQKEFEKFCKEAKSERRYHSSYLQFKEADLKINFGAAGKAELEYKLTDSILKTHFKELMRLTMCYDSYKKTGYITDKSVSKFKALVEKIEKSDAKRAKASHSKTKASAKKRYASKCDHGDLGSMGHIHGTIVKCDHCGQMAEVW